MRSQGRRSSTGEPHKRSRKGPAEIGVKRSTEVRLPRSGNGKGSMTPIVPTAAARRGGRTRTSSASFNLALPFGSSPSSAEGEG